MTVILDNGHGFDTYGKASPIWSDGSQLFEYEFNRNIVKLIHSGLQRQNINSVILVPEALDISLKVRCDRANRIYSQDRNSFLVSVHGNAGEHPNEGTGWEIWTSPGQTKSDIIANYIFKSAEKTLTGWNMRKDISDGDVDKESKFYILVNTSCPAVLSENLFFDNEKDCRFMLSNSGRELIAKLHINGIINYLKEN